MLELVNGRVPLILEIKTADKNAEALTEAVVKLLADYKGLYCLESFDPQVLRYLRRNCPHIVRGQLAEDSVTRDKTYSWFTRFICSYYLENFLTLPDFIAYRFEDRENTSITLCRRVNFSASTAKGTIPRRKQLFADGLPPIKHNSMLRSSKTLRT